MKDCNTIYFSKASAEYSFLSNMHPAPFTVDGIDYKSTEHFFQAAKARHFKDDNTLQMILDCGNATEAKRMGRMVEPFNQEEWDALKDDVMKTGNTHKYANPALQEKLLATGNCHLAECVRGDSYWGIGTAKAKAEAQGTYKGKNMMGRILEEVREHYKDKAYHDELHKEAGGG